MAALFGVELVICLIVLAILFAWSDISKTSLED